MIILAWNISGLVSSDKRRKVRNIVRRYKCDFLILCETKMDAFSPPLHRSIGGGRLTQWEFLPSQGTSGGIQVGWDNNLCSKLDSHLGNISKSVYLPGSIIQEGLPWGEANLSPKKWK